MFSTAAPESRRRSLALSAPVIVLAPALTGVWLGEGRMAPMAAASVVPLVLVLTCLVLGASTPNAILLSWVLAKVAVGLFALVHFASKRRLARPSFQMLQADRSFIVMIGVANVVGLLNYRAGVFIIEKEMGIEATGVYSIAVIIAELMWLFSGSLTQAAYSRIGSPDQEAAVATTVRAIRVSLLASVVVAPILAIAAVVVIPPVLGDSYRASLPLLVWLIPGALVFGAASALSAYFTNHAGKPRIPAMIAALSLLLHGGGSLLLVPRLGMTGAAVAASLSYALAVVLLTWRFLRDASVPMSVLWRHSQTRSPQARA